MKYRPRIYYTESAKALMWDCWHPGTNWWDTTTNEKTFKTGADGSRTRRNFAWCYGWIFDPFDSSITGTCAIDGESRD